MVARSEAGLRLDVVVSSHVVPPTTRAQAKRWIDDGLVAIDDRRAKAGTKLRPGMRVSVHPPPPEPSHAVPEALPLQILYEDPDLIVIDKPAGVVVHPAAGHRRGTLVNALLHRYRELPGADAIRPGIVHRLDKDTSGVMVVTRTEQAREALGKRFSAHEIERVYLAIVTGEPPLHGSFETLYGRHPVDRKRFSSKVREGRRAVTRFRVVERLAGASLVEARLETGRTHQVRVHFSDHGWPLVGDRIYGRPPKDPIVRRVGLELGRQALHAAVLAFPHPRTHASCRFETSPPADFQRALASLRRS